MTRHYIKIQKQKMDTSSIHAHKNFNRVMHRYRRTTRMHRLSSLIAVSGTLLIVLATVYFLLNIPAENQSESSAGATLIDSLPVTRVETDELIPPIPATTVSNQPMPANSSYRARKKKYVDHTPEIALESSLPDVAFSHEAEPEINYSQRIKKFLSAYNEAPQSFTINPVHDTVLQGSKGTGIVIPGNSFVYADGKPVQENITINLQEFYTVPDMILAGLSTTSNGKLLETGGMIYLMALAEDEPLQLKTDREITLKFPYTGKRENMQLFTGKQKNDGTVNWLLTEMTPEQEEVFQVVEQQPEPVGGMQAFYQYVRNNLKYPAEARSKGIQGRVFIQFIVDTDGSLKDIIILKGIGGGCDEEAVRLIENSPKWIPGKQRGKPVKVRMSIPIVFKIDQTSEENNQQLLTPPTPSRDSNLMQGNTKVKSEGSDYSYILKSNKLGWINCDRFLTFNGQKTSLLVPATTENQLSVVLIFKNYQSILPPNRRTEGNFVFEGIPVNEEIIVLGLKLIDNKPFVAFKEIQPPQAASQVLDLHYEPTTKGEFARHIRKLLRETGKLGYTTQ